MTSIHTRKIKPFSIPLPLHTYTGFRSTRGPNAASGVVMPRSNILHWEFQRKDTFNAVKKLDGRSALVHTDGYCCETRLQFNSCSPDSHLEHARKYRNYLWYQVRCVCFGQAAFYRYRQTSGQGTLGRRLTTKGSTRSWKWITLVCRPLVAKAFTSSREFAESAEIVKSCSYPVIAERTAASMYRLLNFIRVSHRSLLGSAGDRAECCLGNFGSHSRDKLHTPNSIGWA